MAIADDVSLIAHLLDDIDQIARAAHGRYFSYDPAVLVELGPRARAACTYDHMVAEAERRWIDRDGVIQDELKGLKFWIIGPSTACALLRFKKMDEDGRSRNYPTKQAKDYDRQAWLPGLPDPAVRLTAGYLLDPANQFIRAPVAKPRGKFVEWCAAIVPPSAPGGAVTWQDVTREKDMFG
jgi:hypothetical protein